MFICVEMIKSVNVGDIVILKNDVFDEGLCAYSMTGEKIGSVTSAQAEGCLDFWTLATRIDDNRVLCRAAIKGGNLLIVSTESKLFADKIPPVTSPVYANASVLSYR